MSTTATIGTVLTLDDVLTEGTAGQYVEVDLTDAAGNAISTAAITGLTGSLRSLETDALLFEDANLLATARATYPGAAGRVRVTFTVPDMATAGPRQLQRRMLTLTVAHSVAQVFHCGVVFGLVALADA